MITNSDARPCCALTKSGKPCKRLPQPGYDRCAAHLTDDNATPGGRPRQEIDLDQLRKLSRLGCTVDDAASFFGISRRTLFARLKEPQYSDAWQRGGAEARISLRRMQFKIAEQGSVRMAIHLGKRLLGQRGNPDPETVTTPPTADDNSEQQLDLSRLTGEELDQFEALVEKASLTPNTQNSNGETPQGDGASRRDTPAEVRKAKRRQRQLLREGRDDLKKPDLD